MRKEIRISGFGGQGIILSGYIIGKAAALFDGKYATLTQSFGPEARGSSCSAQVIVSDEKILYPYVKTPEILVAMSQEGYTKFESNLDSKGIILIDTDLVKPKEPRDKIQMYGIPSTRFAEELGRKIVLNIIMLGFFAAMGGVLPDDAMRQAILSSVPKGTERLNTAAFEKGLEYGYQIKGKKV